MKLKEAEARAEFAEKTVKKLQKEVDRLEGKGFNFFFFFSPSFVTSSLNIYDLNAQISNKFQSSFYKYAGGFIFLEKYLLFCYRRIFSECFCTEFKRVSDVIWQNDNKISIIRFYRNWISKTRSQFANIEHRHTDNDDSVNLDF